MNSMKGVTDGFREEEAGRGTREKRMPDFNLRAKTTDNQGKETWQTYGAAWAVNLKNGTGYSIKVNSLPAHGWDGCSSSCRPWNRRSKCSATAGDDFRRPPIFCGTSRGMRTLMVQRESLGAQ